MSHAGWAAARARRPLLAVPLAALVALGVSASPARAATSGPVDVLYAGSLLDLMQHQLAPAFHRATGYSVVGIANGSSALATQIKGDDGKLRRFINIYVNDEDIRFLGGEGYSFKEGDEVMLIPSIAGGRV